MIFNNPTLVTITAPTCSGKSFLLNEMVARGVFTRIVSTTTRTKRPGETEGVDYYFIDEATSRQMEVDDRFFELVTFNGTRYGVTYREMQDKMASALPPVIVLEPQGLEIYRKKCFARGWDLFQIYVHVTEDVRLQRLIARTNDRMRSSLEGLKTRNRSATLAGLALDDVQHALTVQDLAQHLNEHHTRLLSITGDERHWQNRFSWDAIVPGDDLEKAVEMIKHGIEWRNRRVAEPQSHGGRVLVGRTAT